MENLKLRIKSSIFNFQSSIKKNGFTLIELLVVISIIGILTAVILPNLVGMRSRARDAEKKATGRELKTALRLYYNDYQSYPAPSVGNGIAGCGADGTAGCGTTFSAGSGPTVYMKELPAAEDYQYYTDGEISPDRFLLVFTLENASDQDIVASQEKCIPDGHPYTYVNSYPSSPPTVDQYFVCED